MIEVGFSDADTQTQSQGTPLRTTVRFHERTGLAFTPDEEAKGDDSFGVLPGGFDVDLSALANRPVRR
ncbi:MAG: hypothetical protein EXS09_21185 [Gemmataceae bacterium]|nr:hypothetical protein [Gemmataceae bacterium]